MDKELKELLEKVFNELPYKFLIMNTYTKDKFELVQTLKDCTIYTPNKSGNLFYGIGEIVSKVNSNNWQIVEEED